MQKRQKSISEEEKRTEQLIPAAQENMDPHAIQYHSTGLL